MCEQIRNKKDFWFACVDIDVILDKSLSQSAIFVYTVLCTFATINNRACWPSNETMSEATGLSVATLKRAYKELADRGVIKRSTRYAQGEGQISSYTQIVGHNAECYQDSDEGEFTDDPTPSSPVNHKEYQVNNNNNTLTREAELPDNVHEEISEKENPDNNEASCEKESKKPEIAEVTDKNVKLYLPEDAPAIMKETAEQLLFKTGREGLTQSEISALRELAQTQYPSRVQKEISKAVERFKRRGTSLKFLRFEYIADSLRNQPTLGRKETKKQAEKVTKEFEQMQTSGGVSAEEFETLMKKIHGGGKL